MKWIIFLLFFSLTANSLSASDKVIPKQRYLEYLRLKKQALEENVKNYKDRSYIPQDVACVEEKPCFIVPKSKVLKKVFAPRDDEADDRGIVVVPNIEIEEERAYLEKVNQLLKSEEEKLK